MVTRVTYSSNTGFNFIPVRGALDATTFYGYDTVFNASAASGYQEDQKVTVFLYEDMSTGNLSVQMVLDEANAINGDTTGGAFDANFTNLPVGFNAISADDPGEFNATSATSAFGDWGWAPCCTDGGAVDIIQNMDFIDITRQTGYNGVDQWKLVSFTGETQYTNLGGQATIRITKTTETVDDASFVTPSPAPGAYNVGPGNNLNVTLSSVSGVTIFQEVNGDPSVAEILARDNLPAQNPFIAVVDDGLGRVVFDGGFPSFYNSRWTPVTSFPQLTGEQQYLYNAMNWIVNEDKVRTGNTDILVFNDSVAGQPYDKARFDTLLDGVASIAGYTLTHTNRNEYSAGSTAGTINIPFSTMDQYAAIFVFGTDSGFTNRIDSNTASAFQSYREAGNGLFIITDHDTFQATPNAIANRFGANFFGNVNRSPVSVNFLRNTYGVHPLWLNAQGNIRAGGSEGNISVTSTPAYTGGNISLPDGLHTINVIARDDNTGDFTNFAFGYAVNVPNPITVNVPNLTVLPEVTYDYFVDRIDGQNTDGIAKVDNQVVGDFTNTGTFSNTFDTTNTFPTDKLAGVRFEVESINPFQFANTQIVSRYTTTLNDVSLARNLRKLNTLELEQSTAESPARQLRRIKDLTGQTQQTVDVQDNLNSLRGYFVA
jgi:hypothetical protein